MPEIHFDFPVNAPADSVFDAIATPMGLDSWWTRRSSGTPETGSEYALDFGSGFEWRAVVTRCRPSEEFAFEMTFADDDWIDSRIEFKLDERNGATQVQFCHAGWPEVNSHYRTSSFCWAMYLRLMKRAVEIGEVVPYERRLEV